MLSARALTVAVIIASLDLQAAEIRVLAKIVDHAITDRRVAIDERLENPQDYGEKSSGKLSRDKQDEALDRVVIQFMVSEEARLFNSEQAGAQELKTERQKIEKKFGASRWRHFSKVYEPSSGEIDDILRQKLLLRKSIAARMKLSKDDPEAAIREWIHQLKARYKVQHFLKESPLQVEKKL